MQQTLLILGILYCTSIWGQINENLIRQKVLEYNIADSVFVFGKWTENEGEETHLKYLGQVNAENGESFKIMTSILFWGQSHHATNRILVYNSKNQYIGNYYIYNIEDLSVRLKNGILIFDNKKDCDNSIKTRINLELGIPKQIFVKCTGEDGDLYNFDNE
jgi:hypothetical protein